MWRSRDTAALFAIKTTLFGLLLTPVDLLLQVVEKRFYRSASKPRLPLIFVCGASRTGTTLVSQVLIKHLPVAYINNFAALFPRSPITASLLCKKLIQTQRITYGSYYGKTAHFTGPNEGFYIWNRWMKADPSGVRCVLMDSKIDDMIRFFGAYEEAFKKPLLNKNNSLNTRASSIAKVFQNSYFICMTRDRAYLAQSLLQARMELQGNVRAPLWIDNPDKPKNRNMDYVQDVCEQVLYHERKIKEQQNIIGPERFWIVSYEEFCKAPDKLVKQVAEKILRQPLDNETVATSLKPFNHSNTVRLKPELFEDINKTFVRLQEKPQTNPDFEIGEAPSTR